MAVSLDLQASPSATFTSQGTGQPDTYTITPTFTLSAAAPLGQPQVQLMGVDGLPTNNRATVALRMAASALRLSDTYLGAQFRRLRTKLGAPCAIKAMAAKLARLVYRMLRYGMKYLDRGAAFYDAEHRRLQIKHLKWKAANLGLRIVEAPAT
jgi:transposase